MEKGRHAPKAVESVDRCFTTDSNTRGYKLLIEWAGKILTSNQVRFDEHLYLFRNREMGSQPLSDVAELAVLTIDTGDYEWNKFTPEVDLNNFEKVHSGGSSDS